MMKKGTKRITSSREGVVYLRFRFYSLIMIIIIITEEDEESTPVVEILILVDIGRDDSFLGTAM